MINNFTFLLLTFLRLFNFKIFSKLLLCIYLIKINFEFINIDQNYLTIEKQLRDRNLFEAE